MLLNLHGIASDLMRHGLVFLHS